MTEKSIEDYLCRQVKKRGGIAYKFTSPSRRGVPDRMVVMPGNIVMFIELKATRQQPTKLQASEMKKLSDLGCWVNWADSKEKVDSFMQEYDLGLV